MLNNKHRHMKRMAGPRNAFGNVSDYICVSDCRSRSHEFHLSLSHTFVEIDHTIISTVILLPSADLIGRVVVSYKRKYVHEVPVNRLFKLAQEKGVCRWTGRPVMTIAVDWDVNQCNKQTHKQTRSGLDEQTVLLVV